MRDRYFKIERPLLAFVVFTVFFSVLRCQTYKHSTRSFLDAEQALTHRTANEAGYLQEGSNNRGISVSLIMILDRRVRKQAKLALQS